MLYIFKNILLMSFPINFANFTSVLIKTDSLLPTLFCSSVRFVYLRIHIIPTVADSILLWFPSLPMDSPPYHFGTNIIYFLASVLRDYPKSPWLFSVSISRPDFCVSVLVF